MNGDPPSPPPSWTPHPGPKRFTFSPGREGLRLFDLYDEDDIDEPRMRHFEEVPADPPVSAPMPPFR